MHPDIPHTITAPSVDVDAYAVMEKIHTSRDGHREVFKGIIDGHNVAVKIASESKAVDQLKQEAETLRLLDGTNRAPRLYLDARSDAHDKQVIVMEFVPGRSLADEITIDSRWHMLDAPDKERTYAIVGQIAHAEQDIVSRGVLYRDYNLQHIVFTEPDHATLIDFGFSLTNHRDNSGRTVWKGEHSEGTWEFMAPEEFVEGSELDESIVTYRLGVLYHLLMSGTLPVSQFDTIEEATEWSMHPIYDLSDSLTEHQRSFIECCLDRSGCVEGIKTVNQFIEGLDWLEAEQSRSTSAEMSRAALKNLS